MQFLVGDPPQETGENSSRLGANSVVATYLLPLTQTGPGPLVDTRNGWRD